MKSSTWLAAVLLAAAAAAGFLVPCGYQVRVAVRGEKEPVLVLPLRPGQTFTIRYNHSVEDAPIWETHSVDRKGRIFIEQEKYLKFGAGMGKMPGVGVMRMQGPYEVIDQMHYPVGDFVLRVGSATVDHTVIWQGTCTRLSLTLAHRAVVFSTRPLGVVPWLWYRWFPHPATPSRPCPPSADPLPTP